ncbi:nicotinate (nicotinamide) nucleotide adenylyltransferase [Parafilimonas sp.]|uniref:nicotinate (nicotinamide) nucleotide adenylyltransferase n=1 Tax=Parafilimonas sp. TaxID=1969739 RepID=UPI0039E5FC32
MNIGLLFGSFNPIHTGHLIIASTVLNTLPLSKIWFVVSPQNPLKENKALLDAEKRLLLVERAIEKDPRFLVSNAEFNLPLPSYTIDTLSHFEQQYAEYSFYVLIGSDSFLQLNQWKNGNLLLKKQIIVYERPGYAISESALSPNIILVKSPLLNISATAIRSLIKEGKSIKYLVPENVLQLIERFYK